MAVSNDLGVIESFGVTEPLSIACATSRDESDSRSMLMYLDSAAPSESVEGWRNRWEALVDLETKVSDWLILECGVIPPDDSSLHAVCRVLTFGSFRLGIIRPNSDIDTLILIPSSVSRDRFFSEFVARVLSGDIDVSECVSVTDARVPIAKVKFRGLYLDILVASVPSVEILHAMDTIDDQLIFKVDEKCMKSMNGIRVADKILTLVPNPQIFREATRMIKFWAQQRGIYSNSVGYFGGVSWAMTVARVCQLFPFFSSKQIVERYFYTFSNWPWEENKPVLLCRPSASVAGVKDWNPAKYASDRSQVMPVVTPIFPSHNTTYNVTETQKTIMIDEIRRGKEMVQLISLGGAGWADLCAPVPFGSLFAGYLKLGVYAKSFDDLTKFKGLVESRIRSLVRCIELMGVFARPNPEFYIHDIAPTHSGQNSAPNSGSFYIGIDSPTAVDLNQAITQFINETMEKSIAEWIDNTSIDKADLKLEIGMTDHFPHTEIST